MAKEKIMTFVQARSKLSEIVDRVAESGDTYVVSKRQKPCAVIMGIDRYRELSGTSKYLKNVRGKRIINLEGIGTAVGDIDEAIRALRKSRIDAVIKKFALRSSQIPIPSFIMSRVEENASAAEPWAFLIR
jgi:prevent-host-death family protein